MICRLIIQLIYSMYVTRHYYTIHFLHHSQPTRRLPKTVKFRHLWHSTSVLTSETQADLLVPVQMIELHKNQINVGLHNATSSNETNEYLKLNLI